MRHATIAISLAHGIFWSTVVLAQDLKVRNVQDQTVDMEYYPAEKPELSRSVRLSPGQETEIPLLGDDPFFVTHRVVGERTVAWKVYDDWGVRLRSDYAATGRVWDVDFTFHTDRRDRPIQVMSATLIDPDTGDEFKIFDQADNAQMSDFLQDVIDGRWDTIRNAPDGDVDNVQVDFKRLRFSARDYTGEFRDMCVGEQDGTCYIVGRWWLNARRHGGVRFAVSQGNGVVIEGHCTLDGEMPPRQYPWRSR